MSARAYVFRLLGGAESFQRGTANIVNLLLHQTAVTGDAEPFSILVDPRVGKASEVLVGLDAVDTFGVVVAGYDRGGRIGGDFDVLDVHQAGFEFRIGEIGKKLSPIADFSVVLGVNELIADHGGDGSGVAADLSLIPHALKGNQIGSFFRIGDIFRGLRKGAAHNCEGAKYGLDHGASAPALNAPFRRSCGDGCLEKSFCAIDNTVATLRMSRKSIGVVREWLRTGTGGGSYWPTFLDSLLATLTPLRPPAYLDTPR